MIVAGSLLRPDGSKRRLEPSPAYREGTGQEVLPLGLLPVPNVSQGTFEERLKRVCGSLRPDFEYYRRLYSMPSPILRTEKTPLVLGFSIPAVRQGFSLSRFRSGEMTGGRFTTGLGSAVSLNPRSGVVITQSLTQKARTKIRRAIQNAEHDFKCFLTVTFSPGHLHLWECNADGSVRHDFAKYKFKKFLHSMKVSYDRKQASRFQCLVPSLLAYVWVAEIQKNGNIHFHVLLNQRPPIKWLTALWGQANNSIDVRSINNLNHASCYIRKYMEKEKSSVQGNRYGITQGLRSSMTPEKTVINGRAEQRGVFGILLDMMDTIELNGGRVLEHGFYIPTPCRSVAFRGNDGTARKSIAVSAGLGSYLLQQVNSFLPELPF